jgi:putative restriction endonuclease
MTPLDRLRIEKAAADCGFEMTPELLECGLRLRSARFPERLIVRPQVSDGFVLEASNPLLLEGQDGAGMVLHGYGALYQALSRAAARARTLPNRVADRFRARIASLPRATEAERLVIQRVGQDLFRSALVDYWQAKCCVTGLMVPELLRASHIKPWADCSSDDERLDVFNGLLLAPHLDALFDGGWITFDDSGHAVISPVCPQTPPSGLACRSRGLSKTFKAATGSIWPITVCTCFDTGPSIDQSERECRLCQGLRSCREASWTFGEPLTNV